MTTEEARGAGLRATLFDAHGRDREVELQTGMEEDLGEHHLLWIDVDGHDEDDLDALRSAIELPDDSLALLAEERGVAKMLRFADRVHLRLIAMQAPDESGGRSDAGVATSTPIDIIVARNTVVTVHDGSVAAFEDFLGHIRGETRIGALDAADFLVALVDSVLAAYLELVETIVRRIDALDEMAIRSSGADAFLKEIVQLRRRVAALRRALAPHRWAFAPLTRPDFELEGVGKPWPGIVDRLDRTIDAVENARELLIGAFDVYMATSAQRTNEVMKTLTILSAILLPAVVLAGVMGMNFQIGFFDNPANFWLAIGAMLTLAVAVLGLSRWRGWI
ncbi:MAG TPA: CorA family divalent cation transporter [Candidatus Limnocylindria bacterium]|jgi:Mg2+ and Co2+ transporter CorA